MQKKEGIKSASGASKIVFEVTPSRMSENAFLECKTNITFVQSYTKSYILYSFIYYKYCSWDYILLSLMENMKAANTSKKKGTMYWGANTAFLLQLGGKQRNWVGNCPLVCNLKEALQHELFVAFGYFGKIRRTFCHEKAPTQKQADKVCTLVWLCWICEYDRN